MAPTTPASIVGTINNNLLFNNTTGITNTSNAVVAGTVTGDPVFNGTTVNIPAGPPSDLDSRLQEFVPTALAVNAGNNASYAAAGAEAGSVDVDSLNERLGGHDRHRRPRIRRRAVGCRVGAVLIRSRQ